MNLTLIQSVIYTFVVLLLGFGLGVVTVFVTITIQNNKHLKQNQAAYQEMADILEEGVQELRNRQAAKKSLKKPKASEHESKRIS